MLLVNMGVVSILALFLFILAIVLHKSRQRLKLQLLLSRQQGVQLCDFKNTSVESPPTGPNFDLCNEYAAEAIYSQEDLRRTFLRKDSNIILNHLK